MTTYLKPLTAAINALINAATAGITPETESRFHTEAEAAERHLLNKLLELAEPWQAERFIRMQVQQLVVLDDRLHEALGERVNACLSVLRDTVRRLTATVPGVDSATLPLPKGVVKELVEVRRGRLTDIKQQLSEEGVEDELLQLVGLAGEGRSVRTMGRYRYLNRLLGELEAFRHIKPAGKAGKGNSPSTQLADLLVQSGYNHLRFYNYCASGIVRQLKASHSMEGRLAILDQAAMSLRSLKPLGADRYEPDFDPIDGALLAWIAEERSTVLEDTDLVESEAAYHRIQLGMSVAEEAVMAKLLYDEQLVREQSLDIYAGKLAVAFSSKERESVSATSIRSKMNSREPMVLLTVKSWLEKMTRRVEGMI